MPNARSFRRHNLRLALLAGLGFQVLPFFSAVEAAKELQAIQPAASCSAAESRSVTKDLAFLQIRGSTGKIVAQADNGADGTDVRSKDHRGRGIELGLRQADASLVEQPLDCFSCENGIHDPVPIWPPPAGGDPNNQSNVASANVSHAHGSANASNANASGNSSGHAAGKASSVARDGEPLASHSNGTAAALNNSDNDAHAANASSGTAPALNISDEDAAAANVSDDEGAAVNVSDDEGAAVNVSEDNSSAVKASVNPMAAGNSAVDADAVNSPKATIRVHSNQDVVITIAAHKAPDNITLSINATGEDGGPVDEPVGEVSSEDGKANATANATSTSKAADSSANTSASACRTGETASNVTRSDGWFAAAVSPPGTPCVFGVDELDGGTHCIVDDGQDWRSFGWCWTSKDRSSWGSCTEDCPLFGPAKVVDEKLDRLLNALKPKVGPDDDDAAANASSATPVTTTTTTGPGNASINAPDVVGDAPSEDEAAANVSASGSNVSVGNVSESADSLDAQGNANASVTSPPDNVSTSEDILSTTSAADEIMTTNGVYSWPIAYNPFDNASSAENVSNASAVNTSITTTSTSIPIVYEPSENASSATVAASTTSTANASTSETTSASTSIAPTTSTSTPIVYEPSENASIAKDAASTTSTANASTSETSSASTSVTTTSTPVPIVFQDTTASPAIPSVPAGNVSSVEDARSTTGPSVATASPVSTSVTTTRLTLVNTSQGGAIISDVTTTTIASIASVTTGAVNATSKKPIVKP